MSNTISAQHPAVVLRSSYLHLRALLAVATIVIVGLTVAVVVLSINGGNSATASTAASSNPSTIRAQQSVRPNPDELGVAPVARSTPLPVTVRPNPDELGVVQQTPLRSISARSYPGQF